jgi:hypothetical protein
VYKTQGYSAASAASPLASTQIPRRDPTDRDVDIEILFCGICHSDLHTVRNEGASIMPTVYPVVPGHEIVGRVTRLGSAVTGYEPGDLAADLKEQAGGPIANPREMGFTHQLAVSVLASIPDYVIEFKQVFGTDTDKVTIDEVTQAIAEFEKTLVTANSRFDRWLLVDKDAITAFELEGYHLFKNSGCVACHNGEAAGGTSFQKMGLVEPYKAKSPAEGRSAVTGKHADRFMFKVPTLRNGELTYPDFHDGEAETLAKAVDIMGRLQLGKTLTLEEKTKIVAFLKTLTGDQPSFLMPILTPSTDKTPPPKPFRWRAAKAPTRTKPGSGRVFFCVRPVWARSWRWKFSRELTTAHEAKRNCTTVTACGEEAWSETAGRGTRTGYEAFPRFFARAVGGDGLSRAPCRGPSSRQSRPSSPMWPGLVAVPVGLRDDFVGDHEDHCTRR